VIISSGCITGKSARVLIGCQKHRPLSLRRLIRPRSDTAAQHYVDDVAEKFMQVVPQRYPRAARHVAHINQGTLTRGH
jgi:hypothetical protein